MTKLKKRTKPIPNYTISIFKMGYVDKIWRVWLEDSSDFYSKKEIDESTCWEGNNKYSVIEKIDLNDIKNKSKRTK